MDSTSTPNAADNAAGTRSVTTENETSTTTESVYREYVLSVSIVTQQSKGRVRYRFEAPNHRGAVFRTAESAELYADVYFDVNGFEEEGTGERGVPPVIIQAGRDTLAAYLLTHPHTDINWVASFYGKTPPEIEQYVAAVRTRAEEIREGAKERGITVGDQ